MCRNIKTLYNFEPPVNEDEIRAASLQFSTLNILFNFWV